MIGHMSPLKCRVGLELPRPATDPTSSASFDLGRDDLETLQSGSLSLDIAINLHIRKAVMG